MAKIMAYEMADGTVQFVIPSKTTNPQRPGETDDQFIARKAAKAEAKSPTLRTAVRKVAIDETVAAALDRSKRHAYRFNALKTGVVVDPLVPAPIDPRAAAIDAEPSFTAAQRAAMKRIMGVR